jgi:alpha-ketoglutarate-dependent taurine dioxygenase
MLLRTLIPLNRAAKVANIVRRPQSTASLLSYCHNRRNWQQNSSYSTRTNSNSSSSTSTNSSGSRCYHSNIQYKVTQSPFAGSTNVLSPQVRDIRYDDTILQLAICMNGRDSHYHQHQQPLAYSHVWLRDHCPCSACIHADHRQKMHSTGDIPLDIRPKQIDLIDNNHTIKITWSGDLIHRSGEHTSYYPLSMLLQSPGNRLWQPTTWFEPPIFWRANDVTFSQLWIDYHDLIQEGQSSIGLRRCLHLLARYGLCFIDGVPNQLLQVEKIAEQFGPIRETFYGRSWNVQSVPQAKNIAYTDVDLGLHMDLLYFESPPGLQLLHCLANSVTGGSSVFADAYRAAHELRQRSLHDFNVLRSIPVTFHYQNDGHHLRFRRPTIIAADDPMPVAVASNTTTAAADSTTTITAPGFMAQNSPLMVNYAPPFQGMVEIADINVQRDFYRAFNHLESILHEDGMQIEYTLQKGQCVIFANRRVLHGRRAFDATSGHRHLRGTYVDLDAFQDRYRVVCNDTITTFS